MGSWEELKESTTLSSSSAVPLMMPLSKSLENLSRLHIPLLIKRR